MMHLRELRPSDAPAIARIESMMHPRVLADGSAAHERYLHDAAAEAVNLSFGVFDGNRLVGYILCYGFEPTSFPAASGDAIYIEDVAVLPEYRLALPKLLKRLFGDVRKYFPGAAVEAHALDGVFQMWHRHTGFFERIGFTMTQHRETGEVLAGETRYQIRWEPMPADAMAQRSVDRLLAKLSSQAFQLDGADYQLKIVRTEDDWAALEPVWDELLLGTDEHTVFQSFAYQRLWWRHFGGDNELFILLMVRDGVIEGIAPLQRRVSKRYMRFSRELSFIGSRWQVDRPTFLFPRNAATLHRLLVQYLTRNTGEWDICELYEQRAGTAGTQLLEAELRAAGHLVAVSPDSACPYLAVSGSWADFLAQKSSTFRKNLKTAARRLRERGEVRYQTYEAPADVTAQLEIYRELEGRSWKDQGGVGMARDDGYFAFHRELAELFARDRAFRIRMLTVDGKAVAGTFGLEFDGVFYSLQIAHDREYARCSPGTYLESLEMEECFGTGVREYEFLGGFLNNKSRWTSTFRHTVQLHVYRRTPFLMALFLGLHRVKPWVKDRIRPYMKSWRQAQPPAESAQHAGE